LTLAACLTAYGTTIAYWNFEDGVAGQPFTPTGQPNGSGYTADTVSGLPMYGWDATYGPSWSSYTPDGSTLGSRNNGQDGYVTDPTFQAFSPEQWTIEVSVLQLDVNGWKTVIGKDGSSQGEPESDFYLSSNGIDNKWRINFDTMGGQRWIMDTEVALPQRWYGVAVTSDGATLSMYLDKGSGYYLAGSMDISAQTPAENAIANGNFNWTFGRGWYNGGFVDHINGYIDNVRFSDVALSAEDLIGIEIPEPATLALLGLGGLLSLRKRK